MVATGLSNIQVSKTTRKVILKLGFLERDVADESQT